MQILHRYILSYVDIVANANNIAYLHYLASRLKTVADATYPGDVSAEESMNLRPSARI